MNVYELIKKKRDGLQLSTNEIGYLIDGMISGEIPDYPGFKPRVTEP